MTKNFSISEEWVILCFLKMIFLHLLKTQYTFLIFIPYKTKKKVPLSFGMEQNIPINMNRNMIYTEFEHFQQSLFNNIKILKEVDL